MNFPMIVLNVFGLFAIAGAFCCWIFAAVAVHHRKMRSANFVPAFAALLAAFRFGMGAEFNVWYAAIGLVAGYIGASMIVSYLYGWARARAFDEDEVRAGSGRFAPVRFALNRVAIAPAISSWIANTSVSSRS